MSNSAAADQTKLRKRLETLLKLPENQFCCDCGKRGTLDTFVVESNLNDSL